MALRPSLRALALGLGLALLPASAGAVPKPEITASIGHTAAVAGDLEGGGIAMDLALTWPFEGRFEFGVQGFADDLGTRVGRLLDPNDPSIDLGAVAQEHRWAWGAAWRLDANLPAGGGWTPFMSGTYGYYRLQDDRLGRVDRVSSGTGLGIGAGARHAFRGGTKIGATIRYQQLIDQRVDHYLTATADLRWKWGA